MRKAEVPISHPERGRALLAVGCEAGRPPSKVDEGLQNSGGDGQTNCHRTAAEFPPNRCPHLGQRKEDQPSPVKYPFLQECEQEYAGDALTCAHAVLEIVNCTLEFPS